MDQNHPPTLPAIHPIWIPAWLYHGLPRASLAVGLFGLLLVPEQTLPGVFCATAAAVYGMTICIIRAEHHRGEGHGW